MYQPWPFGDIADGDSDELNMGYFALGFFVIVGIPAIIISLIVWKIKKWRAKRKLDVRL